MHPGCTPMQPYAPRLANMPEFHEAWHVQAGDAMHIPVEDRVDIW